jgi:hypothetical protein
MRSKGSTLGVAVSRFEGWRAERRGHRIPEELWNVALGLLDEHSPTAICRALRLNASRFNRARREREKAKMVTRSGRTDLASRGPEFVELPGVPSREGAARVFGLSPVVRGCRVTIEGPGGVATIAVSAPEDGVIEAVRDIVQSVFGARA